MEPITIIISALVLGTATGLKSVSETGVKEAYQEIKKIIQGKYDINLSGLEKKPDSNAQREAVKENLVESKANEDEDLLDKAKNLIDLIKKNQPELVEAKGLDLGEVEAEYLKAKKIIAEGNSTAVKMDKVKILRGIELEDIQVKTDPK